MIATLIVGLAAEINSFVAEDRKKSYMTNNGYSSLQSFTHIIRDTVWNQMQMNKAALSSLRKDELDRFLAIVEKMSEDHRLSDIHKAVFADIVTFYLKNYERIDAEANPKTEETGTNNSTTRRPPF